MAEAKYFCPECASPELRVKGTILEIKLRKKLAGLDCLCELCGWKGKVEELIGAVSQEGFYDIEKVSSILLGVTAKHAAGPLCQALELVGLIEKEDSEGRNHIMRNVSAAMITAAFQSAGTWATVRQAAMQDPKLEDEGTKECPYCEEEFDYPYVHNCAGRDVTFVSSAADHLDPVLCAYCQGDQVYDEDGVDRCRTCGEKQPELRGDGQMGRPTKEKDDGSTVH